MKILLRCALGCGAAFLILALAPSTGARQSGDPMAAVQAALDRYQAESDAYRARLRAATAEERPKLTPPPVDGYVREFAELARSAPGSEAAAKAWMMVVQLAPQGSDKAVIGTAVERLARDHGTSELATSLGSMLSRAGGSLGVDVARGHLRTVIELAPTGAVQAGALLGLATSLGDDEATTAGSPGERELEALVGRLSTDYAELLDSRGRTYGSVAEGIAFARKHLQVGLAAPEVEAADTQGVAFKLSDYRGKVVLLDFWGNW
jgi:hypothetical protein